MTAQKLTKSSTTDAFKAFKHALQPKKVHPGKVELNRREREAMSQQQQQQQQQKPMTASAEAVWRDAAHGVGLRGSVTCERTAAVSVAPSATAATADAARARPATVEPDSHNPEERRNTPAVAAAATAAAVAAAAAPSSRNGAVAAHDLSPYDERDSAVPVSPPSSPMHVAAQRQTTMGPAAAAGAGAATEAVATSAGEGKSVTVEAIARMHQSPSGGGGPATPAAAVDIPPAALPPPALSAMPTSTAAAVVARQELGDRSGEAGVVTAGAGAGARSGRAALSPSPSPLLPSGSPPAPAVPAPAPVQQLRLGRGRKLCPNCNALTKSAVKQCRECQHFFSPASSRLRPPPREPKENEEAPMPPRRRLRPSQRLIEYELSEASPAALARDADGGGGSGRSMSASARRPLAASNAGGGGGGANQRVASGGGGGRPAAADGAAGKKPLPLGGGSGGGGAVQPPKRSHKRKIPLPPGVAPPKRKKGAAAAARALASTAPCAGGGDAAGAHRMLPSLSLPERQRVAEDLLASSSPATAHTLVPRSPELTPTAAPTGPLLFMPSAASLEDDSEWLSPPPVAAPRSGAVPGVGSGGDGGGGGIAVPVCGAGVSAGVGDTACSPLSVATSFSSSAPVPLGVSSAQEYCSAHAGEVAHGVGVAPPPGLYAHEIAVSAADYLLEKDPSPLLLLPPRRQEDVIDLSAESQDRDPFEGVELWLEGGSDGAGGEGGERRREVEVPSTMNAVSFGVPMTFQGVGVGRDGTMEQRVLGLDESMDLLGDDTDDDAMWNRLRGTHSGANDCNSETSADSLALWSEENGGSLLDSAALTSRHYCPSSTANVIYSTVERGAARAVAPGPAGSGVGGCGGGGGGWDGGNSDATVEAGLEAGTGEGRGAASAASLPEEEHVCFSSLKPLALADGGVPDGGSAAAAAVSLDAGGDSGGGGGGEGRPWGVPPSREATTPLATTGGFYPRPVAS